MRITTDDPTTDPCTILSRTCFERGNDILFFGWHVWSYAWHGLVRATDGTKISKTEGNVVDPLDTVGEYDADSLRYSLVTGMTPGQDIPLN